MEDTIAAIATPFGEGSVGIVRLSGVMAERIVEQLFIPKNKGNWQRRESHRFYLGYIREAGPGEKLLDEVLVVVMKEPHSYTTEDVVEIHCHGGILAVQLVLETVIKAGARVAEPGEFTRRAFLNGRLDLAQAEAIIDIIRSKSSTGLQLAVKQLQGGLSEEIGSYQQQLLKLLAYFEAAIDFPEDEIEILQEDEIKQIINNILININKNIENFNRGKMLREGLKTVILGKPNVGKSSLLNALVKEQRAIVTDIPGTTRDIIEEIINLEGIPLKVIDTAGIRQTEDLVEKIGVEKSKEVIEQADLVLLVLDAGTGLSNSDRLIFQLIEERNIPVIVLINKIDLEDIKLEVRDVQKYFKKAGIIEISATQGKGLDLLETKIKELVGLGQVIKNDQPLLNRVRHLQALEKAEYHLREFQNSFSSRMPMDFLTIDLKAAWEALGKINGTSMDDNILDKIFAEFCIGK